MNYAGTLHSDKGPEFCWVYWRADRQSPVKGDVIYRCVNNCMQNFHACDVLINDVGEDTDLAINAICEWLNRNLTNVLLTRATNGNVGVRILAGVRAAYTPHEQAVCVMLSAVEFWDDQHRTPEPQFTTLAVRGKLQNDIHNFTHDRFGPYSAN